MTTQRTAFITGANQGIGLEVARQLSAKGHRVIIGARDLKAGEKAAQSLPGAEVVSLDLSSEESVLRCTEQLSSRVDILVNNAGVYPQDDILNGELSHFREAFEVHFFGVLALCQRLVPGMIERGFGRVVNVSSGYGSVSDGLGGSAAYSLSKAALNALTLKLSQEVRGDVLVNAVCPGWVRTRMGGRSATLSVEEGADTVVWLATLPAGSPNGRFFRNRAEIPW